MKRNAGIFAALLFAVLAAPAHAALSRFEHIVMIVQENRTPDNLFHELCRGRPCSTSPGRGQYNIQVTDWLDRRASGGVVKPTPLPLNTLYGPRHTHGDFLTMCDFDTGSGACKMDGAADITCLHCPLNTQFTFVDNSRGMIDPYLFLAVNYGWANYMFQTNQGPSFPAHQFLFGATSAPNRSDDHKGTFAAENSSGGKGAGIHGCTAPSHEKVPLINADGVVFKRIFPCFEHQTLSDLLDSAKLSWRYYTPGAGSLWSAPDAIRHICVPSGGVCTGTIWLNHLALNPADVLADVQKCQLPDVSWVIPSGLYSDHAGLNDGSGPRWVAGVINAIGSSKCKNADGTSYWDSTAIVLTWDDWGGFYDHEPPTFLPYPEGAYQYGFRVPFLFISAYTPQGYINNDRQDFGDVARFVESNFGITMGALTFADARSTGNLAKYYDLAATPRAFVNVPAGSIKDIRTGKVPLAPPDDD